MMEDILQENKLLLHIHTKGNFSNKYSQPVESKHGKYVDVLNVDGKESIIRLLTYIPGTLLYDVPWTAELAASLAKEMVEMLTLFEDAQPIQRPEFIWKIENYHFLKDKLTFVEDEEERKMAQELISRYEEHAVPHQHQLRSQVIHGDMNEINILTDEKKVTGVIDFADSSYSQLVNEVAIAMYYAGYHKDNFLEESCLLLKQFHKLKPLKDEEIRALFSAIGIRSCMGRINFFETKAQFPDNQYLYWNETSHKKTFHKIFSIEPAYAEKYIREKIGSL